MNEGMANNLLTRGCSLDARMEPLGAWFEGLHPETRAEGKEKDSDKKLFAVSADASFTFQFAVHCIHLKDSSSRVP